MRPCGAGARNSAKRLPAACATARGRWYLNRVFIQIQGVQHYLWCAVDQDGVVLDILVQDRRDSNAAKRFFRGLLKALQYVPRVIVTDKLRGCRVAQRHLLPGVEHRRSRYLNNRAENSHRPTRRRERQMQRFKSSGQAQNVISAARSSMPTSIRADTALQPSLSCDPVRRFQDMPAGDLCPTRSLIAATRPFLAPGCPRELNVTMPVRGLSGQTSPKPQVGAHCALINRVIWAMPTSGIVQIGRNTWN